MKQPMTYKDAGVDIDQADEANRLMKEDVRSTYTEQVLSDMGSFGGLFRLPQEGMERPLLVASTDGVGTKLKLAVETGRHDTVGQDLVNHCVNDILVQGALPLFFLDYIGTGKLEPAKIGAIVRGFAIACKEAGIPLLGGETAELPGLYQGADYDLAGTIVGMVDEQDLLPRKEMKEGDLIVGLPSRGLHTNGYSLALKVVRERMGLQAEDKFPGSDHTVAEVLMEPHQSYLPVLKPLLKEQALQGMAHITGGGLIDNLPRILPDHLGCEIDKASWPVPPLFKTLMKEGSIPEEEAYRAFNMGIGMALVVSQEGKEKVLSRLGKEGKDYFSIGQLTKQPATARQEKGASRVHLT